MRQLFCCLGLVTCLNLVLILIHPSAYHPNDAICGLSHPSLWFWGFLFNPKYVQPILQDTKIELRRTKGYSPPIASRTCYKSCVKRPSVLPALQPIKQSNPCCCKVIDAHYFGLHCTRVFIYNVSQKLRSSVWLKPSQMARGREFCSRDTRYLLSCDFHGV